MTTAIKIILLFALIINIIGIYQVGQERKSCESKGGVFTRDGCMKSEYFIK